MCEIVMPDGGASIADIEHWRDNVLPTLGQSVAAVELYTMLANAGIEGIKKAEASTLFENLPMYEPKHRQPLRKVA
ncbi:hypothetical protein CCP4SC76_450002 [Gammaproteobacteria bacterium]